jgi:glutamate-5-semialdehyde dehydrogenase
VSALDVRALAIAARAASRVVAKASESTRCAALVAIAAAVRARSESIIASNRRDLENAIEHGLSSAMIDRLRLDQGRIAAIARAVDEIAAQPALVGRSERQSILANGLVIAHMRIPLGVVAIVYESRPNVTIDAAALCLKSGNAAILRGGSEAIHSNLALAAAISDGLAVAGLPAAAVTVVPSTDREAIGALVQLDGLIDLVIPRGGEGLIRFVAEHARVPVIKHYKGVCHLYIHAGADLDMAIAIADNGKVSRPGVCNAVETILIDRAIAPTLVPRLCAHLIARGVEIRGDATVVELGGPAIHAATSADWDAEYLELIVAMRVVEDLDGAIAHIEAHGSDHTESIITADATAAERFLCEVGSSTVMHNASTRFADGGELGLGAEIGVSTTRLHAYGPMGAEGLTTCKFVVRGTGQVRI